MTRSILIAGASGRTGRLLVADALEAGHLVTALVRPGSRTGLPDHPRLRLVVGNVLEPTSLPEALLGCDVMISLLAPRPRTSGRVYIEGTRNLADAAASAGVRRFIAVSAEGAGVESSALPLGYRLVRRIPVVARLYPDIARMESELTARTDVDWTVVRPAILTNGPRTRRYRCVTGPVVPGGLRVSRADLAAFLLDVAAGDRFVCEVVALAD